MRPATLLFAFLALASQGCLLTGQAPQDLTWYGASHVPTIGDPTDAQPSPGASTVASTPARHDLPSSPRDDGRSHR